MNQKTAIILGATGLTGSILLNKLLQDDRYAKILLFGRNSVNIENEKITEHLIDLFELKDHKESFKADEVFCCIGTTAAKTPDKEIYKKIDYGIPASAAKLCKENNIRTFIVISAMGADPNSNIFCNKVKGLMETAVLSQQIPNTYILRPSLIGGKREERRIGEYVGKVLMSVLNFLLIGPLKKYRSIHPERIATAMIWLANNKYDSQILSSDVIQHIAKNGS
ncbi:NAD(P)H-binding protein [Sungkyunkwania multivorans]|uniref:NAD(P)H-binding protein n=1 Tax=Sungkyunkwania multivorans TaxID=1173618 RepID=A0ABW3D1A7_9FLAO